MSTRTRPDRILYGVFRTHESLCFFDESFGAALDAEVTAVKACGTIREAVRLRETLIVTDVPGVPRTKTSLRNRD